MSTSSKQSQKRQLRIKKHAEKGATSASDESIAREVYGHSPYDITSPRQQIAKKHDRY
jgi:hypothetical protein